MGVGGWGMEVGVGGGVHWVEISPLIARGVRSDTGRCVEASRIVVPERWKS